MSRSKKFPISKSEADWREELMPDEFNILREREPNFLLVANTIIILKREFINVKVVVPHCINPKINLTVTVAGQVMIWLYLVL